MRYFESLGVALFGFAMLACGGDRGSLSTGPTVAGPRRESLITHFDVDPKSGLGRGRVIRERDLPAKDVNDLRRFMNPELSSDALIRAWYASVKLGEPTYAVSDASLPENAAAIVVRDPSSSTPRLIVVSKLSVDDVVLGMARHALRVSETGYPTISDRRTIVLWADHRFRVITPEGTRQGTFEFSWLSPERHKRATKLLARASRAPTKAFPGIGTIRILSQ